jgi:hypothetical protein
MLSRRAAIAARSIRHDGRVEKAGIRCPAWAGIEDEEDGNVQERL